MIGTCKYCGKNINNENGSIRPQASERTVDELGWGWYSFCVTTDGRNKGRLHAFSLMKDYIKLINDELFNESV